MDKLPELALIPIFNSLSLSDQFKNRRTCKKWKVIIESMLSSREELVLFCNTATRPLVWFHNYRPVDLLSSVIVNEKFRKSQDFERLFKNVQRLYLVCLLDDLFKSKLINFLNDFRHLQHLQLDTINDPKYCGRRKIKILFDLPNLKSFSCNSNAKPELLHLNCPKLKMLSVLYHFQSNENCASFKDSLKFLKVASFFCDEGFEFPNLEVLVCQNILPIDISPHKKLREIHFFFQHVRFLHSIFLGARLPPEPEDVLNELSEQKRALERSELQIYYQGVRCTGEPGEFFFRRSEVYIIKSHMKLVLQNSGDLKLEHQRKELDLFYNDEIDEAISAISAQQAEKLARCLVKVTFCKTLSKDNFGLDAKFKILFKYVQVLKLAKDIRTQSDLDRLPELFPHLTELERYRSSDIYSAISNPKAHPDYFRNDTLNFRFLASFKALHTLKTENWRVSPSELSEMVKNCRFLEKIEIKPTKLEELPNREFKTKLATIEISISKKKKFSQYILQYMDMFIRLGAVNVKKSKVFSKKGFDPRNEWWPASTKEAS